jgi:GT2 family glycosyltransferase
MPDIYVIIVTYNAATWLDTCIKGLAKSTLPVTTLVIDNNSTDDTLNILHNEYPDVRVIENKNNLGFGRANNLGIQVALAEGADYIFLLNQDACIFPDTLQTLVAISQKHPEYMILSPLHLESSGQSLDYNFSKWVASGNNYNWLNGTQLTAPASEEVYTAKFVNAALWLLPKNTLLTIGGFDPLFFHYGEDIDFTNRVNYHGYKVGVCPAAKGIHFRKQPDENERKKPTEQMNKRKETGYLILLKNINRSFFYCFLQFSYKFLKMAAESLKKGKMQELMADFKVYGKTIFQLPQIAKHRSISKSQKYAFLSSAKGSQKVFSKKTADLSLSASK